MTEPLNSDSDAEILYASLPNDGSARGNTTLQSALDWNADRYYAARDELLDRGLAQKWRGRGGSLRRVPEAATEAAPEPEEVAQEAAAEYESELSLYNPMAATIAASWAADERLLPSFVVEIAQQGRRQTGGKWSRPDIVLVSLRRFRYVPGRHLDVVSFEVKLGPYLDVTAVYEALAHRRRSTRAVVLVHSPGIDEVALEAVTSEAERHGIGLVVADDPADYSTWNTLVDAETVDPDPEELNRFLTIQLPEEARQQLSAMLVAPQQADQELT